jgi:acyl-CoA synthetase (NDP forming)
MHQADAPRASLAPFFSPSSVAVIGASSDPARIGGRPLHGMKLAGYAGRIYPVNPRYTDVMGLACYPSLDAVAGPVDLALIALPAAQVPAALEQCAARKVAAVSVFSSGFAEVGGAGDAAQQSLLRTARAAGLRLLGPNCMGTLNAANGFVGTFTSTLREAPVAGPVSVVSQSGAFAAHCYTLLRDRGVGIDLWAATGNEADVSVAACLAHMAASPATRVIVACVEGVRDAREFIDALALARALGKPVVLIKLGGSAIGAAAVASHTAALAGSDRVFDSVLDDHGVYRAHSVDELIDIAYAVARGRAARSRALGLASISGGFGIMMADAAEKAGLELPALSAGAQEALRHHVPFSGTRNPVDLTAQIINEPALLEPMMNALLDDRPFGSAVLFLGASGQIPAIFDRLAPALERLARRHAPLPMAVCLIAGDETRARLESWGYLVFEDPTRTLRALAALARLGSAQPRVRSGGRAGGAGAGADVRGIDAPGEGSLGQEALGNGALGQRVRATGLAATPATVHTTVPAARLNEFQAKALLREAGLPAVRGELANTADEAVAAAGRLGYPVVMKVLSPDIVHKTEAGCVRLNLRDAEAVRAAHAELLRNAARVPGAQIDGLLVEAMAGEGVEMILGVQNDPVFGPVIMAGLGGIFVEVLTDVALRVAPVNEDEALGMLRELKGYALLSGARGRSVDTQALAQAIAALSRFALAQAGRIASVDVNPFLASASGGLALDAVIVPRTPDVV